MRIAAVFILLTWQLACVSIDGTRMPATNADATRSPSVETTVLQKTRLPAISDERLRPIVQAAVLRSIYYCGRGPDAVPLGDGNLQSLAGSDLLLYRRKGLQSAPANLPEHISGVDAELLNGLKAAIAEPVTLDSGYDVDARIAPVDGDQSVAILFDKERKRNSDLKAVVAMSEPAFSSDRSQAIVYCEYFTPSAGESRFIIILKVKIDDPQNPLPAITIPEDGVQVYFF